MIDGGIYVRSREDFKRCGRGLFERTITEFAKNSLKNYVNIVQSLKLFYSVFAITRSTPNTSLNGLQNQPRCSKLTLMKLSNLVSH